MIIYRIRSLCPYVKVFSRDMTSDKPLHVLKEINFARFNLQQSLSKYFPFNLKKIRLETHLIFRVSIFFYLRTLIIPLLEQITNSIMEILRNIGLHYY